MSGKKNILVHVFLQSASAMFKVGLVSSVGVYCSMYPKGNPLISKGLIKELSRLSNFIFIPALVVASLGSTVSIPLLRRFGVLIFICLIVIVVSYMSTYAFKWLHEEDLRLFAAIAVAVGSPNAISIPLLVMKTMCEDDSVNADYSDASSCFNEASSMMFVYSIGWHLVFWSYGFPVLKSLDNENYTSNVSLYSNFVSNVILSPCMLAIYIGVLIGIIEISFNIVYFLLSLHFCPCQELFRTYRNFFLLLLQY